MIKKIVKQRIVWALALLLLADGLIFSLTSPNTIPSYLLIGGFLLLALTLFVILRLIASLSGVYLPDFKVHARRLATLLTILSMVVLVLQSIGQLSPKDALVLTPLVVIIYSYIVLSRRKPKRKVT